MFCNIQIVIITNFVAVLSVGIKSVDYILRWLDALCIFSIIFQKGDNFSDLMLAYLHMEPFWKGVYF